MESKIMFDWHDILGYEVYSRWAHIHLMLQGASVSMGFTAESKTPQVLTVQSKQRSYALYCPDCKSHFIKWHNWYDAKQERDELMAICEQGHLIKQANMLVGEDVTNEDFWKSLRQPLTKSK